MTEILDKTKRIIAERADLQPDELSRDSVLADLEIESLDLAEIIADLEDEFDVEIDLNTADAWDNLRTVGDVVDAVSALVSKDG